MVPTDAGRVVVGYADDIFALGREMTTAIQQQNPGDRPLRFNVGVVDSVPKMVAKEILRPALEFDTPVHLVVREGKLDELAADLATHRLDLVLADHPYSAPSTIRIFHHRLGECGLRFFAAPPIASKLREGFPRSLDGAPALLPADNTAMRRSLESWFDSVGIRPRIVAEFEDSALLKVFGSEGLGFFALPSLGADPVPRSHGVQVIGSTEDCRERFFALSAERRLKHPAVLEIRRTARRGLLGATG